MLRYDLILFRDLEYLLVVHEVNIDASDSLLGDILLCGAAGAGQNGSCIVLLLGDAILSEANLKECRPLHIRQGKAGILSSWPHRGWHQGAVG
jgi:hypothetical protein